MSTTILGHERFSQITVYADANTAVKKGDHVASFSSGNGFAKTATATVDLVFIGRARSACDNTGGAAGAKSFDVDMGREVFAWKFKNDEVAPFKEFPEAGPNVFGKAYLSAANTVSPDDDGGARPLVGRAWFIDKKTGLVIVERLEA
jgi:hypothetical protein